MNTDTRHLLIISSVWPEPDSSAAGERMMQLLALFQASGWSITYASTAAESAFMVDIDAKGIERISIEVNSSRFDDSINKLQPSAVIFDRFLTEEQFGWRVAHHCPNALRILDTEDLHCLRRVRQKAVEEGRSFTEADLVTSDDTKREIASIYRCDLSLIISEYEINLIKKLFNIDEALLHYLPFLLEPMSNAHIQSLPRLDERHHFTTIGNFRHAPNLDTAKYLKQEVWPLIAERLPEAELHIYGAYPSAKAKSLHQPDRRFYVDGRAESAEKVMSQARVCLAPLRFGAGLKGKLVKAMHCGTPSVTTSIGAEGIAGDLPWPGIVAEHSQEVAEAAVKLYEDEAFWEQSQKRGISIINERFAKEPFSSALMERIASLREGLEAHRLNNFTGALLMHHTAASTKYMSRWIEEKNRS